MFIILNSSLIVTGQLVSWLTSLPRGYPRAYYVCRSFDVEIRAKQEFCFSGCLDPCPNNKNKPTLLMWGSCPRGDQSTFHLCPNKEGQDRCSSAQTALISVTVQSANSNLVTSRGQSSTLHKPATPLGQLWSLRTMNSSHHFFYVASFFRWNCLIWDETVESDGRCPGKVDVDPLYPYLWNLKKREVVCDNDTRFGGRTKRVLHLLSPQSSSSSSWHRRKETTLCRCVITVLFWIFNWSCDISSC